MKKLIFAGALMGAMAAVAVPVSNVKVRVVDSFGGDASAVLARCQTKAGTEYDAITVSRDVTSLNSSGEYEEINADAHREADGVEVVFYVKRKMRYQEPLEIEGNSFFGEGKIAKEAALKDGALYGDGDLAEAAARVRKAYQKKGYRDAKVNAVATPIEGAGNACSFRFVIDEGKRGKIAEFEFDGAESIERAELREAIGDYSWWDPRGWLGDAPVTTERLAEGREKLAKTYRDAGYLDVEVEGPTFRASESDDEECVAVYAITEGTRYTIGSTKISGVKHYPAEVVAEKSALPAAGVIAGEKELQDAAHRIMVTVGSGDSGLAESRVEYRTIPNAEDETKLDVEFVVTEGVPVVINDVVIEGNDYTKDKVIRREITLGPGNRMLEDQAERSQKRLENLDYFSRVRYYLRDPGLGKDAEGREYRDLVYEVDEKNTGNFMVGVGASSVDHVYLMAEVSQSNFDLFAPGKLFRGAGQKARVYAQVGPRIQTYEASVTEPWFLDRQLELTVEAYRRQRWFDEYDIIRTGGALTLAYPVKFWPTADPFGRFGIRWTNEFIEFDDEDSDRLYYKGRYTSLKEENRKYGDAYESVFRFFWSHNSTDSFRMPSTGSRTSIYLDVAGFGDNKYYRAGFNHRNYWTTWERYHHVLMFAFRAETIDGFSDDVPIYNRLFLGGPKSIRGIEYRHVSPFARKAHKDGDLRNDYMPWGGQSLICANLEYTIPVVKMLRLAAFTDIGSVSADEWDISDDFAWTVGLGIRLDIPMFPIRLDFATPIEKPSHADEEVFSFSVGYDF